MFGAQNAGIPPKPDRNVWASETESRMQQIRMKIKVLQAELFDAAARCNHTLPNGTSYLELHSDEDGSWTRCKSCGG